MTGRSQSLSQRYSEHNRGRGRGFIYGGQDRVAALSQTIGSLEGAERVLDLGCRDGSLAEALGLPAGRTIGADIDEEALVSASSRRVLSPCIADLWGPLPFRSNSFDLVLAGEIVEHVPFPEELVHEISRVLRTGGRVVGSVPNAFRLKNRLMFLAGRWFEYDPTHLRQFSPDSLRRLLSTWFVSVRIRACVGRWSPLWPHMLGNDLVWSAVKS